METVTNLFGGTIGLILLITIVVLPIIIFIVLIRWLFRINEIAGYLERIANRISPQKHEPNTVQSKCDFCHNWFFLENLKETTPGKMICPDCLRHI
jgi:hypothetical protein